MTDEENVIDPGNGQEAEETQPSGIAVGITPWGSIGINITDSNGVTAGHVIEDPAEAWQLAGHISAIATMMVQARYAMAMQEQRQIQEILQKPDLYVPGNNHRG